MKTLVFIVTILFVSLLFSCGTSPNSMEKNPFTEEMGERKIKKIDQIDLVAYSQTKGKEIISALSLENVETKASLMDSLQKQGVVVKVLDSISVVGATDFEKQILDAYYGTPKLNQLSDNIQEVSNGSFILYNSPIVKDSAFVGMYSILFKKDFLIKYLHELGKF